MSARFITDFESLSGATVDSSTALSGNLAATGADYGVKSGYGADDGNAFVLGLGDASKVSQGLYSEATYNPLMDENAKMEGAFLRRDGLHLLSECRRRAGRQ